VTAVKICGLKDQISVSAACKAGARYVGFVFFDKSPRNVSLEQAAELAGFVDSGVAKVALTSDADDATLDEIVETVPIDIIQLHGEETPERVASVRERYRLPTMRAVGISSEDDLPAIAEFSRVADQLLIDAKPPANQDVPGGNGVAFDWRLLQGRRWAVPWLLAGGLTPENVAEAVRLTGAAQVDVSSGVERARGAKDPERIRAFLAAAG